MNGAQQRLPLCIQINISEAATEPASRAVN